MQPPPTWQRWCLAFWPRWQRARLGREVIEAFSDERRDTLEREGRLAAAVYSVRGILEIAWQGLLERLEPTPVAPIRPPRPPRRRESRSDRFPGIRSAAHSLRAAPAFTLIAVATLAIGIGANTAIFTVVNGVLLAPLPYDDPQGLVVLTTNLGNLVDTPLSEPELFDLRQRVDTLSSVAAIDYWDATLGGTDEPERLDVARINHESLPILGIEPAIGRAFNPEEDAPEASRVVLLSHGLWQRAFAARAGVVGEEILLEGIPHTVIGVMPVAFAFPHPRIKAWVPLRLDPDNLWERNNHYLMVIGRLAAGIGITSARDELAALAVTLNREYPDFYDDGRFEFRIETLLDSEVGDTRSELWLLMAAVAFVLLVACTNVAHLMLARAQPRRKEFALRLALGCNRAGILRQLMAESMLLALLGGLAGVGLAIGGVDVLLQLAPDVVPRADNVGLSLNVLLFTLAVSILTSLVFGLVPALQVARVEPLDGLRDGDPGSAGSVAARRSRSVLVAAEVALAAILLVGGGTLLRSFVNLRNVDPGFDYRSVLTMWVSLPQYEFEAPTELVDFYERVLERAATLPDVEAVAAVGELPLASGGGSRWSMRIENKPSASIGDAPVAQPVQVTPGYFELMRLRLLEGRTFGPQDRSGAAGVAVVSAAFADEHWPGGDALGKRVKVFVEPWPWVEVIGVVDDVKQIGLDSTPHPMVYFPHAQAWETAYFSPASMHVIVRHADSSETLGAALRQTVEEINPAAPIGRVAPMQEILEESLARERFVVALTTVFAAIALGLVGVGITGVMGYTVAERTREIGVRMALGAQRGDVLRLIVVQAFRLTAAGLVLGLAASAVLSRWLQDLLFGVTALDPGTYAAVCVFFVACCLAAAWLPARRAAVIDPTTALRDS